MLPLLPKELKGVRGGEVAKHATEVIRSYFTRHYRKSVSYISYIILKNLQSWLPETTASSRPGQKSAKL